MDSGWFYADWWLDDWWLDGWWPDYGSIGTSTLVLPVIVSGKDYGISGIVDSKDYKLAGIVALNDLNKSSIENTTGEFIPKVVKGETI